MTSKEAARTLLYGLSRGTSNDKYLDAICLAVCALMREEEAGKGKHEEKQKIIWHFTGQNDLPEQDGMYDIIRVSASQHPVMCSYQDGLWVKNGVVISDVMMWAER